MSKQKRSKSQVQQFLAYQAENRHEKNKIRALARHVKANDKDEEAAHSLMKLKADGTTWKRKININSNFEPKRTQLEAELFRKSTTGATMVDDSGNTVPKIVPVERRGRVVTSMTLAFNKIGIKDGRIYRAMQA